MFHFAADAAGCLVAGVNSGNGEETVEIVGYVLWQCENFIANCNSTVPVAFSLLFNFFMTYYICFPLISDQDHSQSCVCDFFCLHLLLLQFLHSNLKFWGRSGRWNR